MLFICVPAPFESFWKDWNQSRDGLPWKFQIIFCQPLRIRRAYYASICNYRILTFHKGDKNKRVVLPSSGGWIETQDSLLLRTFGFPFWSSVFFYRHHRYNIFFRGLHLQTNTNFSPLHSSGKKKKWYTC